LNEFALRLKIHVIIVSNDVFTAKDIAGELKLIDKDAITLDSDNVTEHWLGTTPPPVLYIFNRHGDTVLTHGDITHNPLTSNELTGVLSKNNSQTHGSVVGVKILEDSLRHLGFVSKCMSIDSITIAALDFGSNAVQFIDSRNGVIQSTFRIPDSIKYRMLTSRDDLVTAKSDEKLGYGLCELFAFCLDPDSTSLLVLSNNVSGYKTIVNEHDTSKNIRRASKRTLMFRVGKDLRISAIEVLPDSAYGLYDLELADTKTNKFIGLTVEDPRSPQEKYCLASYDGPHKEYTQHIPLASVKSLFGLSDYTISYVSSFCKLPNGGFAVLNQRNGMSFIYSTVNGHDSIVPLIPGGTYADNIRCSNRSAKTSDCNAYVQSVSCDGSRIHVILTFNPDKEDYQIIVQSYLLNGKYEGEVNVEGEHDTIDEIKISRDEGTRLQCLARYKHMRWRILNINLM
jgi:hypothetical protein